MHITGAAYDQVFNNLFSMIPVLLLQDLYLFKIRNQLNSSPPAQ